jgi:hypothetical protein
MTSPTYQRALHAAQSGDRKTAYLLFKQVVLEDPSVIQAWVWMGKLVDDPELQRECLQRALLLDPSNVEARAGMDLLLLRDAVAVSPPVTDGAARQQSRKLGAYLVDSGHIAAEQLEQALAEQQRALDEQGQRVLLGDILIRHGWLTVRALATAIVMQQEEQVATKEQTRPQYLGDYLIRQRILTAQQLRDLLVEQARLRQVGKQVMLGQLLIYGGHITMPLLEQILEQQRQDFLNRFGDPASA